MAPSTQPADVKVQPARSSSPHDVGASSQRKKKKEKELDTVQLSETWQETRVKRSGARDGKIHGEHAVVQMIMLLCSPSNLCARADICAVPVMRPPAHQEFPFFLPLIQDFAYPFHTCKLQPPVLQRHTDTLNPAVRGWLHRPFWSPRFPWRHRPRHFRAGM